MNKRHLSTCGLLLSATLLCGASGTFGQSTLTLRIDSAFTTINKSIYGALLDNWGRDIYQPGIGGGLYVGRASPIPNTLGMRNDIIAGLKNAGISCLEWPGGCFADSYNWRTGIIEPPSSRPGGEFINGYSIGTLEYFQLLELTGAQGYLAFNDRSDSAAGMAAWLTYIDTLSTHPEWRPLLKYMKVGNEEWGGCYSAMAETTYESTTAKFLAAIPSAYKSQLTTIMDGGDVGAWITAAYMKLETGKIDGLSLHYYAVSNWTTYDCPSVGFTAAQYYLKLNDAYAMETKVSGFETIMNAADPTASVGLMVDEWGIWSAQLGTTMGTSYNQSTVREALAAALTLNTFNNHCERVKMALIAQPTDVIQALFLTKPNDTDSTIVYTPTYYTMKMMKVHQNARKVPAHLTTGTVGTPATPIVSASASVDSTNALHITLTNIDIANTQTLTITLTNPPQPYQTISAQIINGPTDSSYNDFGKAENVNAQPFAAGNYALNGSTLTVTLPAHSVVQFALSPSATGTLISPEGQNISTFSIKPAAGKVAVHYAAAARTPMSLMLLGVDGRVIESASMMVDPGHRNIVWQPKTPGLGGRVVIVKITAAGATGSVPMVLAR